MENSAHSATAFAPATVANVAVGFDVLGFAVAEVGDRVTVRRDPSLEGVVVDSISGRVTQLPRDPERNTASVAILALIEGRDLGFGFRVSIEKGIPLGSGMGGSAASAVAAVVAANALLERPVPREELLRCAAMGEQAASGAAHADNAAPCLYGGMVAVVCGSPFEVVEIPAPIGVQCVLVHPDIEIETRAARASLRRELPLADHVKQSMHLAGFLAGCFRDDLGLIRRSMVDLVAEPTRAKLIPGFDEAKAAALRSGAIGFGISGSGPSVFAWVDAPGTAEKVRTDVSDVFAARGFEVESWISAVGGGRAAVMPTEL